MAHAKAPITDWTAEGKLVRRALTTLLTAPISHMLSTSRLHTSSCPQWAAACRGVHPSVSLQSTSTLHCNSTLSEVRELGGVEVGERTRLRIKAVWLGMVTKLNKSQQAALMCALMLTSGLQCSLWQRRRVEPLPWCLGEVWVCRLLPAPPWHPGAWSSPLPFGPYPRLFLWQAVTTSN